MTTTPEALTPEEREHLQRAFPDAMKRSRLLIAKLLRIHDQQAAALERAERLRERLEAWRDYMTFDSGDEEATRVMLTRLLNDKDRR